MKNTHIKNQIEERLKELEILEKKEKEKLVKLKQQKEEDIKKTLEKTTNKNINTEKHTRKKTLIALGIAGKLLANSQKTGNIKIQEKEENKKEITIKNEPKKIEKTINLNKETVENKTIKFLPSKTKKEIHASIKKKTHIPKEIIEEDVFLVIEQPDPNVDPKMYSYRKGLSNTEKNTVKDIYTTLLATENLSDAEDIVNTLDRKILQGLRDILVKKIILLKNIGKNVERYQSIAQMTMNRENDIITQNNIQHKKYSSR